MAALPRSYNGGIIGVDDPARAGAFGAAGLAVGADGDTAGYADVSIVVFPSDVDPLYEPKGLLAAGAGVDVFHGVDLGPNDDDLVVLEAPFIIPGDTENPAGPRSVEAVVAAAAVVVVDFGGDRTGAGANGVAVAGTVGNVRVSLDLSSLPPDDMDPVYEPTGVEAVDDGFHERVDFG